MAKETRQRILDAAARLITRDGAPSLTLDGIAREAGMSKGGLLYHFENKEALLSALLDLAVTVLKGTVAETGEPGAQARTAFDAAVKETRSGGEALAGVTAALSSQPALLSALREPAKALQKRAERDGIDPAVSTLVRLAADGLRYGALLGYAPVDKAMMRELCSVVDAITTGD